MSSGLTPRRGAILAALRDDDPDVRQRASEALDRLDVLESLPDVLARSASLGKVRWVALLRSLQGIRDEGCLKVGIRALDHGEEDVRLAALELVESFCDWRATAHVTQRLSDPSPVVRGRAAEVIGRLGDRRAAEKVAALLDDSVAQVVARAASAVGRLGHKSSEGRLIDLIQHPDPEVRGCALSALGRIGVTARS